MTLIGNKALGQFNLHIDKQRTEIIKDKHEEIHSILLYLFGQSKYFDITIELLKNELVGYFDGGTLLREINARTITSIKNTKYTNPIIKNDQKGIG